MNARVGSSLRQQIAEDDSSDFQVMRLGSEQGLQRLVYRANSVWYDDDEWNSQNASKIGHVLFIT